MMPNDTDYNVNELMKRVDAKFAILRQEYLIRQAAGLVVIGLMICVIVYGIVNSAVTRITNAHTDTQSTTRTAIPVDIVAEWTKQDIIMRQYDNIQINCIAIALYGEARGEQAESMVAVAYVIMNRTLLSNGRYPTSPCGVITQKYQFEPIKGDLLAMVNSSLQGRIKFPDMGNKWLSRRIRAIARDVYYFQVDDPTNLATHFWSPKAQSALNRPIPTWSTKMTLVARIGGHIYYK